MTARWNDTLVTLGETTLPTVIKGVDGLNTSLQTMTGLMDKFPKLTTGLTIGAGALLGLATIGGTLMLATAGFRALGTVLTLGAGAGMGSKLLEVAGGLGGLASKLGAVGLALGVGTGAYALTRLIADAVTPDDWTFGGWLNEKIHGDPNAEYARGVARGAISRWVVAPRSSFTADAAARAGAGPFGSGSPFVAPPVKPIINVYVNNKLDRNGLATMVTEEQGKIMSGPQIGPMGFDGSVSLAPAGGLGGF
jgi:hypothetical protein